MAEATRPAVFTIPTHRSFADSLAEGVLRKHGCDPQRLARGRIFLPNNRAVRAVTEAFVRASGSGLVLPRLIPIGDPELDERLGEALDSADLDLDVPPAIDPLERQLLLATLIRAPGEGATEALRLAADLSRAIDALEIEEIAPHRLAEAASLAPDLAEHWQRALARFLAVLKHWPPILQDRGQIDLATRRGILMRALAQRWGQRPPAGFTLAAGVTTAAPAVAGLLARIARLPEGGVILPGLALADSLADEEWDALGPDEHGRGEPSHPQFHLKLLLDRMGVARAEVERWPAAGRGASTAARGRAVANAMSAARFSDKWSSLRPSERRLTGVRCIEVSDPAIEAQAIAIALREALEVPGRTAALLTPDRTLAARVSAHLGRWGIAADDSAGQPLSTTSAGSLMLALVAAAEEEWAPVAMLALAKHPLVGGEGEARLRWIEAIRMLDAKLRGPRPPSGLGGLDRHFGELAEWRAVRPLLARVERLPVGRLGDLASWLRHSVTALAGERGWSGPDGRAAAEWLERVEQSTGSADLALAPGESLAVLRALLDSESVRRPYGGHPRVFIWGLLEGRLQQADLMILGGLNEGVWPSLPSPDPWLAPALRRLLGLPSLENRIGLAAHDFAEALGAPRVLLTRARRDSRSPTVASRLWRRLQAMTGGLTRDVRLERLAQAIDAPSVVEPARRPAPRPPVADRPKRIAVTDLDRLNADPFAFYAKTMLRLRALEPVDAEQSAKWKGTAVHEVLEAWFKQDECAPDALIARAKALVADEAIHPMVRTLWSPRLMQAIAWIAEQMASDRTAGRLPLAAERKGEAEVAGVRLYGVADRIDRMEDGRLAVVDYKTGKAPAPKAVAEGFALQLGLLALIAERGGFHDVAGQTGAHEYWSLAKDNKGRFGTRVDADKALGPEAFVAHALRHLEAAASAYLNGDAPFTAKLHPAYAPYADYDQLMRLEEWYGREDQSLP